MKRLLILLTVVFLFTNLSAQDTLFNKDSIAALRATEDSLDKRRQEEIRKETYEQMDRNLSAFVKMQKEREKKEKQRMYVRIGLGVLFLIVLIVGLKRRKKAVK